MSANAFITGSRAYGTPSPGSDVDLVVFVDAETLASLRTAAAFPIGPAQDGPSAKDTGADGASLRFGALNVIATTSRQRFDSWASGTRMLKGLAPVTRSVAVAAFKELFEKEGPERNEPSEEGSPASAKPLTQQTNERVSGPLTPHGSGEKE